MINAVRKCLCLGELVSTSCSLQAVLLSFLHSGVSGEVACALEHGTEVLGVVLEQSSGDTVTDRARLTGHAAAGDVADNVKAIGKTCQLEGLTDDNLECVKTEVIVDLSVVDDNLACSLVKSDSGNGALSSACAIEKRCFIVRILYPPSELHCPCFGLLSLMLVLCACVEVQSVQSGSADSGVGNHALYGKLHHSGRSVLHKCAGLGLLQMTDVTGMTVIDLLLKLAASENCLVAVDDDHMVAAVYMGSKDRLGLTSENIGCQCCDSAYRLACRVDDIPLAVNFAGFWHKC